MTFLLLRVVYHDKISQLTHWTVDPRISVVVKPKQFLSARFLLLPFSLLQTAFWYILLILLLPKFRKNGYCYCSGFCC